MGEQSQKKVVKGVEIHLRTGRDYSNRSSFTFFLWIRNTRKKLPCGKTPILQKYPFNIPHHRTENLHTQIVPFIPAHPVRTIHIPDIHPPRKGVRMIHNSYLPMGPEVQGKHPSK